MSSKFDQNGVNYSIMCVHLLNQPCSNHPTRRAELYNDTLNSTVMIPAPVTPIAIILKFLINSNDKLWSCLQHTFKVFFLHRQTLLHIEQCCKQAEVDPTHSFSLLRFYMKTIYSFANKCGVHYLPSVFIFFFFFIFSMINIRTISGQ